MDKQKALEIAKDRIKSLQSFIPLNESENKISKETMEFLIFVKEMLEG